jgi:hypothetical protein
MMTPEDMSRKLARLVKRPPPLGPPRLLVVLALGGLLGYLAWVVLSFLTERPPSLPLPPAKRQPLEFNLIRQRHRDVRLFDSREKVEAILGPPTERNVVEPDLLELAERVEVWNRHLGVPNERTWDRWADPNDKGKWVTIYFAGGKVYWVLQKGF